MGGREGGEHVVKGGGTGTEEESHNWRGTLKEGGGEGREGEIWLGTDDLCFCLLSRRQPEQNTANQLNNNGAGSIKNLVRSHQH